MDRLEAPVVLAKQMLSQLSYTPMQCNRSALKSLQ
jgi:hypothetical protein